MAISEKLCWEVLKMAEGKSVLSSWLKGEHCSEPSLQNAIPLFVVERDLVLRHKRSQIEDSLYFLEKRGYLLRHGFQGLTRVAFQLSDTALDALKSASFLPVEQQAFREALLDVKQPSLWGMKLNLGEALRRFRKTRS